MSGVWQQDEEGGSGGGTDVGERHGHFPHGRMASFNIFERNAVTGVGSRGDAVDDKANFDRMLVFLLG